MLAILHLLGMFVVNRFRSRRRLEVENLFLWHQLNIALRRAPHRLRLLGSDRAVKAAPRRERPSILHLLRWPPAAVRAQADIMLLASRTAIRSSRDSPSSTTPA